MYRGWKSAGCRGWPVPKRGFGYGSIMTSAQVKRRGADDKTEGGQADGSSRLAEGGLADGGGRARG